MTHTEGKWEARCKNGELYNPLHDLDGYGAPEGIDWDVYAVHPPQSGGNTETLIADAISKGDANLIASAPELLAFAQKWVEFKNGAEIDMKELWFMATQAIAKAEDK